MPHQPNRRTYNAIMYYMAMNMRCRPKTLAEMERFLYQIPPDALSWSSWAVALLRSGRLDESYDVLLSALRDGHLVLSSIVGRVMVRLGERGYASKSNQLREAWHDMARRIGSQRSADSVGGAWWNADDIEGASTYVESIIEGKRMPDLAQPWMKSPGFRDRYRRLQRMAEERGMSSSKRLARNHELSDKV